MTYPQHLKYFFPEEIFVHQAEPPRLTATPEDEEAACNTASPSTTDPPQHNITDEIMITHNQIQFH